MLNIYGCHHVYASSPGISKVKAKGFLIFSRSDSKIGSCHCLPLTCSVCLLQYPITEDFGGYMAQYMAQFWGIPTAIFLK